MAIAVVKLNLNAQYVMKIVIDFCKIINVCVKKNFLKIKHKTVYHVITVVINVMVLKLINAYPVANIIIEFLMKVIVYVKMDFINQHLVI